MLYKEYGSTGINVSAVGFGGMRFEDQKDVEKCASLLKRAYDKGINYFDTAPGYGDSEKLFGAAFKDMLKTRDEKPFYVSTKTMEKNDPGEARRELETSLERMGLEYIDFYHVWCVLSLDDYFGRKKNGIIKEFEKFKDEGLVKHIVVSTHMTGTDVGKMLDDYPFEGVLLGYSAANFAYREAGIEAAGSMNTGVVVMNPLNGGLIPQHPEKFQFLKTRPDENVAKAGIRFLLNDPRITIALVGMANERDIDEAVQAAEGYKQIPQKTINDMKASLKDNYNELCTACQYCDKCPQGIEVPKIMDSYNIYMLTGKTGDMIDRLRYHWGIDLEDNYLDKCTECGVCEKACTQKLPIIKRLKFVREEAKKVLEEEKMNA